MASGISLLFHGWRWDLWHPKALGFFAPKLLLATVKVPKGAIRGPLVQKKPSSQLSMLAVRREDCKVCRPSRSATAMRPSHCHCPGIALVMHAATLRWADTALAHLGVTVHAHLLCLFCSLCHPDGWIAKLSWSPYSIHLHLKQYL